MTNYTFRQRNRVVLFWWQSDCRQKRSRRLVPKAPSKQIEFGTSGTCKNRLRVQATLDQRYQVWRRRRPQKNINKSINKQSRNFARVSAPQDEQKTCESRSETQFLISVQRCKADCTKASQDELSVTLDRTMPSQFELSRLESSREEPGQATPCRTELKSSKTDWNDS